MTTEFDFEPDDTTEVKIEKFKAELAIEKQKKQKKKFKFVSLFLVLVISSYVSYDYLTESYSNERLFKDYYKTYNPKADKSSKYLQAIKAYENKDFSEAVELFSEHSVNHNIESQYSFYLAMSLIECKAENKAISILEEIAHNNENQYYEVANWYIGLCYIKNHSYSKARKYFKILKQNSIVYKKQSINILQDMDN